MPIGKPPPARHLLANRLTRFLPQPWHQHPSHTITSRRWIPNYVHICADPCRWWGYLSQWNLLDYPAIILPVSQVLASDVKDRSYTPVNELDRETYDLYDPQLFLGAPIGVQLIGRSMREEELLSLAMAIDRAIKN